MSEITGKISVIGTIQKFSNDFYKRDVVVETFEEYPQPLSIEFVKGKADIIDKYSVGDSVKVSYNLRGRKWESPDGEIKYFNSIQGWKIEKMQAAQGIGESNGNDDFVFDN